MSNFNEIPKPFKRYQLGIVWRNEKPGPGRYREFLQFDADYVGTKNLQADAELCILISEILENCGLNKKEYIESIKSLHSADQADSIESLPNEIQSSILRTNTKNFHPDFIAYLREETRDDILHMIRNKQLVNLIKYLDLDDAVEILGDFETKELVQLIPYLKNKGAKQLGILGKMHSAIASQIDIVLDASVNKEICTLNLAPTASTTVAMAIGDALAVVWMEKRGISRKDFAINHPAGKLGRELTLKVSDLMKPSNQLNPLTTLPRII